MRRSLDDFLSYPFPIAEPILGKWLAVRGLGMLAGFRGVGKTFASLGIATAVASGSSLLGWEVPRPRGVLLVDGEMDPAELQGRLKAIKGALPPSRAALAGRNLKILTHADYEFGIPNLGAPITDARTGARNLEGRKLVEAASEDCDLIILDNISTLAPPPDGSDGNGGASWQGMQDWLLMLRRKGKAVLLIEHGGKPGEGGRSKQRGTSRKEDVLNTSIMLQRPPGMGRDKFVWEWTKTRGWLPEVDEFTVQIGPGGSTLEILEAGPGAEQEKEEKELAAFLHGEGYDIKQISERCPGISRSVLYRMFPVRGER